MLIQFRLKVKDYTKRKIGIYLKERRKLPDM